MKAYGKKRLFHVEKRVRRPYRGGRGCICCVPRRPKPHKKRARAEGKKEVDETEDV